MTIDYNEHAVLCTVSIWSLRHAQDYLHGNDQPPCEIGTPCGTHNVEIIPTPQTISHQNQWNKNKCQATT